MANIPLTEQSGELRHSRFKFNVLSTAILVALGAPAASAQQGDGSPMEEVSVTGIRHSLESSAELKRNADVVVDTITAEDVGKFPDANVAESLQRVTGVQISRDRGGEGRFVSIRGLSSQFNMTTLNGRTIATDNAGRDFSFDIMPSEAIASAEIYKTSMASLQEGSIGGLVNLTTAKPLDRPGFRASGSAGGFYDETTEKWTGQYSGVISNTFMDDTVGAFAGVSYYRRDWRSDTYDNLVMSTETVDANGDGVRQDEADGRGTFPGIISYQTKFGQRERLGFVGALQFRPSDSLETSIDAFYSNLKTPEHSYSYNINFFSNDGWARFDNATLEPYNGDDVNRWQITSFDLSNIPVEIGNDTKAREADTYMVGWNTIWQATDALELTFDLAYSEADRPTGGREYFTVAGVAGADYRYQARNGVPSVECTLQDGRHCTQLSNDEIGLHFMEQKGESVNDQALSLRFDGDLQLELLPVDTRLEFGLTYSERSKDKVNYAPVNGCAYCTDFSQTLGEVGVVAAGDYPGSYDYGAGFSAWPALDPLALFEAAKRHSGEEYFNENIAARPQLRSSSNIEEAVGGLYVQANFTADHWTANVGGRWVYTDTTSNGHTQELLALQPIPGSTNFLGTFSEIVPVNVKNSYDNFLPSANFNYDLREDLKIRAALSRSITRPTISQLGPDVNWEINSLPPRVSRNGNPELEPFEADSADLSLEWYGDQGNSAAAALFYKEIDGIITHALFEEEIIGETFQVAAPVNGDTAEVYGLELAYQQLFDNGFGVMTNYTWADSEAELAVNGEQVQSKLDGLSEHTYNLAGIYERGPLSARLAWSFRDAYTACSTCGPAGTPTTTKDFGSLDFSGTYEINGNVSVYLEAQNLTEDHTHTYSQDRRITNGYEAYARRFEVGVRANF